jgi:hypothetical protein
MRKKLFDTLYPGEFLTTMGKAALGRSCLRFIRNIQCYAQIMGLLKKKQEQRKIRIRKSHIA